jgi:hypothetical protein
VISKKLIFIGFLDESGLFIGKNPSLSRLSNIVVRAITFFLSISRSWSFQVSNIWMLRGASCVFNYFDELVRMAPEQQFGFILIFKSIKIAKLYLKSNEVYFDWLIWCLFLVFSKI